MQFKLVAGGGRGRVVREGAGVGREKGWEQRQRQTIDSWQVLLSSRSAYGTTDTSADTSADTSSWHYAFLITLRVFLERTHLLLLSTWPAYWKLISCSFRTKFKLIMWPATAVSGALAQLKNFNLCQSEPSLDSTWLRQVAKREREREMER